VLGGAGYAPWSPGDKPSPISAYGRSKLIGENGVVEAGGRYAILRTSWVYSANGQNFVKTMLRLGVERNQLSIVADQIGGPTPAKSIAAACLSIAEQLTADPSKAGIYHFAGAPDISWAGFAQEIFSQAQLDCEVTDITSAEYPTPAQRPKNSRLDCSSIEGAFGILRPDWRLELRTILEKISYKEAQE
jgi:dTDP-4-dehydrorhamnose reductase